MNAVYAVRLKMIECLFCSEAVSPRTSRPQDENKSVPHYVLDTRCQNVVFLISSEARRRLFNDLVSKRLLSVAPSHWSHPAGTTEKKKVLFSRGGKKCFWTRCLGGLMSHLLTPPPTCNPTGRVVQTATSNNHYHLLQLKKTHSASQWIDRGLRT